MSIKTDTHTFGAVGQADVAIIGAGPTGLLLACEIAASGVHPVILERAGQPDETPKANGLVGHIVPLLDARGLLEPAGLRPLSAPRFPFGPITLELHRLSENPLHILPIPQRQLEGLLTARALELGVTILREHEATDIRQGDDDVTLRVETSTSEYDLSARYVVGCDGARSFARKRLGISFPGLTSEEISRMARLTIPADLVTTVGGLLEIRDAGRFTPFQPSRRPHGSITIAPAAALDRAAPADLYILSTQEPRRGEEPDDDLDVDELRASVRRILNADLPFTTAHSIRSTVANSRQAESYRSGRVFLAGDAAHIFNAGGSALNTGMLDAVNLGWKLAAHLIGRAPADLLDTYTAERHPAGERALLHTRAQAALSADGENGHALRQLMTELLREPGALRRLAETIEGTDTPAAAASASASPLVGRSALEIYPPAHWKTAMRDVMPVLLDLTPNAVIAEAASDWSGRIHIENAAPRPGSRAAESALVRPDGQIAWAAKGNSPDRIEELRQALRQELGPGRARP
jgi:2-polyprenyl-6-methoxyphenol hydroxylase-like FAD-dependent oxidoreductase